MLAMVLLGRLGHDVMYTSSHADAVLPRPLGHGVTVLLSHADDSAAEAMLVMAQCRCRVILAMALPR
jgi:hypothetical protein